MFSVLISGKFNISLLLFIFSLFSALFVLYIITLIFLLRLSFILVKTTRNSYPHDFFVKLLLIPYTYTVQQSTSYFAIVLPLYCSRTAYISFIHFSIQLYSLYLFLSNSRIRHSLYE
jgi:hypothetical protein